MHKPLNTYILYIALLVALHLLSHFLPFERQSLAPDDYANLVKAQSLSAKEIPREALKNPDRPLNFVALTLQFKWMGDNAKLGLWLTFLSSLFLLLLVFILSRQLFKHPFAAFVSASLFCLLPMKIDTYHYPASVNIHLVTSLYLLTLITFIQFMTTSRKLFLVLSLFCYTLAIFWYEIGFFLPAVLLLYAYLFPPHAGSVAESVGAGPVARRLPSALLAPPAQLPPNTSIFVILKGFLSFSKILFLFALPMVGYAVYRLTNAFGFAKLKHLQHHLGFSALLDTIVDLFHHFSGRYMARHLLYGLFQFFQIERPWFWIILCSNFMLILLFFQIFRKWDSEGSRSPNDGSIRIIFFSLALFLISLIPVFLNNYGGIAGRHLLLASVSISILGVQFFSMLSRWRFLFIPLMALLLMLSQGNAWSQIIACRLNASIYQTLKLKRETLRNKKAIIIDTKSFAENIPYTWTDRNFNLLNTYYGAQTFENWGLISMVQLALRKPGSTPSLVYVATTRPTALNENTLTFSISEPVAYRSVHTQQITLPIEGTAVIGFEDIQ